MGDPDKKKGYDWKIAAKKLGKNIAIFLLPSFIALQTNVDVQWAGLLSVVIYLIRNYLMNK